MASEGKARSHKQMTITFTLPISCQICLGKVRQPVLCPNHHVFCSLCLDIWLKRNHQCPACRVDIGPDNPVQHIKGSQLEEEDVKTKSTPEFRRARFDLLYREYEDELEQLHKENTILKMENSILTTQLKDAQHKNMPPEDGEKASVPQPSLQTSDGSKLLLLTKNLQEVQKLYQGIKDEMSELKQENCKLKDESVNLTRENETLRLEIAHRSPKKFGRYTVATLETKLAEQEKEIRQLKMALERSDAYIEELHKQQDRRWGHRNKAETSGSKSRFQINLEPKRSATEGSTDGGGPRKVLFGKVVKTSIFSTIEAGEPLQKHGGHVSSTSHECISGGDFDSRLLQQHVDFINNPATSGHSEAAHENPHDVEESVEVSRQRSLQSEPDSGETNNEVIPDKTARKVRFKDSRKPGDASSFELEMPSPISSLISESYSSVSKDLLSSGQMSSPWSGPSPAVDCQVKMEIMPLEGEDKYYRSFLDKNVSPLRRVSASKNVKKTNITVKENLKAPTVAKKAKKQPVQDKMDDSSHLSIPDVSPPEKIDNFSQSADYTEAGDDFDMSLTPEMTDCLRLIDQAEKKVSSMSGTPSVIVPQSGSAMAPARQAPQFLGPPDGSTFQRPTSLPGGFPPMSISTGHRFASSGSSVKSWEQHFYDSVKVNPHKVGTFYKPPDFSIASSHNPLSNDQFEFESKVTCIQPGIIIPPKLYNSSDFIFSEPIKVTFPSSNL